MVKSIRATFGLVAVARIAIPRGPAMSLVDVGGRKVNVQVVRKSSKLFLQLPGQPKLQLFAESATVFSLRVVDATAQFETDAAGGITAFTLVQNGRRQRAPRSQL